MIGPAPEEIDAKLESKQIRPLYLDLYPEHQGYSMTLPGLNCVDCHTRLFSYDEHYELLESIDKGEVPTFLVDLIERFCVGRVFYKGCLAVKVRDFRTDTQGGSSSEDIEKSSNDVAGTSWNSSGGKRTHDEDVDDSCMKKTYTVHLRPTVASLTADLNRLLDDLDDDDGETKRKNLESEFWKLVSSNLCFENRHLPPNPIFSENLAKRRKVACELDVVREKHFASFKFIVERARTEPELFSTLPESSGSQWKPMLPSTKWPTEVADKRLQAVAADVELNDDRLLVEEYLIEFPSEQQNTCRSPKTRIVISRRKIDCAYLAELIVERSSDDGDVVRTSFLLGSEYQSKMYVSQYLEMVSEGGRKPLTLTRTAPGKPSHVIPSKTNVRAPQQANST